MKTNAVCLPLALILSASSISCSPKLDLKAVKLTRASVESSVNTTSSGTVTADQQAILGFGVVGRVARIQVNAGDIVRKGQGLAELENTDLKTVLDDAGKELKRSQELFDAGLVSQAAADSARKAYEIARANLDKTIIKAPFDGVITEQTLELGELSQTSLATKAPIRIVDQKPRLIKGDIDEIDISKVKVGLPARVKIQAIGGVWVPAHVTKVVPFVSTVKEKDRTTEIELRLEPSAEKALLPVGASADVEVITERKDSTLALPARTVVGKVGTRSVFRYDNGKLTLVPIKTGIGNYARVEVLEGLKEGDIVVYPPEDIELKNGMKAKIELQPWP